MMGLVVRTTHHPSDGAAASLAAVDELLLLKVLQLSNILCVNLILLLEDLACSK